jgi:hypothetical protein
MRQSDAEDLIRNNRRLISLAREACRETEMRLLKCSIDQIQRCLEVNHRRPEWALAMVRWVAGTGKLPGS